MRIVLLLLAACASPSRPAPTEPVPEPVPEPGVTPPPTDPCATGDDGWLESATPGAGPVSTQLTVDLALTEPLPVAMRCTATSDPTDVHLLESVAPATTHALRLSGLLPGAGYDCAIAPICPTGRAAPVAIALTTGPAHPELAPVTVTGTPEGWTLFALHPSGGCGGDGGWSWLQVVDPAGVPRWWYRLDGGVSVAVEARYHGDGLFVWGGGTHAVGRPRKVDLWDGEVYDSASSLPDWEVVSFHHDGKMLPDGRILTLEDHEVHVGRDVMDGFAVRVHDPATGLVSWEYTAQQAVDAGELDAGALRGDVWHANWADVIADGGADRLYVSLCNSRQILRIDPVGAHVEWTLGIGDDFALVDPAGAPLPDEEFAQCQHGVEVDGDRLLVYDNGQDRKTSRAAEYVVDPAAGTATLAWTWTDGWFERTLGDVDWLPGGNVLVTQAHPSCWSDVGTSGIVEIDPASGAEISRMAFPDPDDALYRAERIDGCALFASAKHCPQVAERLAELAPILGP